MEQLVFELVEPEPPSFANFVVGGNAEALGALRRLAQGDPGETCVVLWGAPGGGKTHLLRATVAAARAAGQVATYWPGPAEVDIDAIGSNALVALDALDAADEVAQARLFTLYNALRAGGGRWIAALGQPPARAPLREDLRSRLGWGLVYEVQPLADPDKPEALAGYAAQRGFTLGREVIDYLLAHGRRDMGSLTLALAALDRHSLATKRPITLPLVRAWIQRESAAARAG